MCDRHSGVNRNTYLYSNERIKMKLKTIIAAWVLYFSMWIPAFAGMTVSFVPESEIAKNAATIQRVESYLTRLHTVVSDFTQTAPDGARASGKFYLQRPGKMRWQYNPPTPVLIVSNGSELVYYDYELQQVSYIPLASSLISFLAQDVIKFSGDIAITSLDITPKQIRIEVTQRDKPTDGKLLLEFSDVPLQLQSMVVTDATGQTTSVALNGAKFGADIDPSLFVFKDPRKMKRR